MLTRDSVCGPMPGLEGFGLIGLYISMPALTAGKKSILTPIDSAPLLISYSIGISIALVCSLEWDNVAVGV
jgi:hypothetical protein